MGIRVIKTAIAALAAINLAAYIGLEPPLSAGLLAILAVEVTRKRGLAVASARFVAAVIGLLFASGLFLLFGFHIWVISLFVLLAFPVLARIQLKDGIITSSVIVFHVFERGEVTLSLIGNEVLLLVVGLGSATILNMLYMPSEEKGLTKAKAEVDELFSAIFNEMAATLRNPLHAWSGEQLLGAEAAITQGTDLANRYRDNRLLWHEAYWRTYFEMRSMQLDSILRMMADLALVYEKLPQAEMLAELFERLGVEVKSEVYLGNVERSLSEVEAKFRTMPLPATREEFEIRASLLQLCHELGRYLSISRRLKKQAQSLGKPHANAKGKS